MLHGPASGCPEDEEDPADEDEAVDEDVLVPVEEPLEAVEAALLELEDAVADDADADVAADAEDPADEAPDPEGPPEVDVEPCEAAPAGMQMSSTHVSFALHPLAQVLRHTPSDAHALPPAQSASPSQAKDPTGSVQPAAAATISAMRVARFTMPVCPARCEAHKARAWSQR